MYSPSTSVSAANPITILIILASMYIGPYNCVPALFPKYVYPPARLRDSGATRQATSLLHDRIMSLALYLYMIVAFLLLAM